MTDFVRSVLTLIGIIIILIACYYTTKFIGRRATGQSSVRGKSGSRSINLLERYAVSRDKSFCIVEIAGKVYVVGMTNQTMTLIDTLDSEKFAEFASSRQKPAAAWSGVPGGKYSAKLVNRLAAFIASRNGNPRGADYSGTKPDNTFADSMKNARDNSAPGQPDRKEPERTDGSEGDE